MNESNDFIISGPQEDYSIWYESLGKYLFDCLNKRKANDIIGIDAFTKEVLTCKNLLDRSQKLSIVFKQLSIQKGDVITLISENSLQNYIILCASLFSGASLNPLNFAYSTEELKYAFEISKPKIIFSSKTALPKVLEAKKSCSFIKKIFLTGIHSEIEVESLEELIEGVNNFDDFGLVQTDLTDTAILCLSSGTTGLPKCVEVSHKNFIPLANTAHDKRFFNVSKKESTVLFLPFFHLYGLDIHLLALTNSLRVISMKAFKPDVFLRTIQEHKVTKLFIAPPILHFLVKSPLVSNYNLTSVKDIVLGASSVKNDIYEEALQRYPECAIRQIYGSTETRAISIQNVKKSNSVGQLFSNTSVKIINIENNNIVGPYEKGEICVKSLSIMKGYFNNHSATSNAIDQSGFYRTGDIGYYDKNNNLYIVDRVKELIKYKGFQVPPAEVENVLLSHLEVEDCAVVGVPDDRCGQLPLAFVVLKPNSSVADEGLIKFVAERISIQKQLHGGVIFIDEIPKLPSGKILRKELIKLIS
ncbi:hypothetical protein FQR65_LT07605 [Abscondita terminalis]|nr:hypothetical protein FQR65_LT07605 [Abscondita terminalis]